MFLQTQTFPLPLCVINLKHQETDEMSCLATGCIWSNGILPRGLIVMYLNRERRRWGDGERTRHDHDGEKDKGEKNNENQWRIIDMTFKSRWQTGRTEFKAPHAEIWVSESELQTSRSAADHNMTAQRGKLCTLAVHVFTHQIYCLPTTGESNTRPQGWIWPMEESNLTPFREIFL